MAGVRIVTDSASDLTRDVADALKVETVPLTIRFGTEEFTDGQNLSVEDFYRRFYFRAPKIASIVGEMVRSPEMMKRRLREGIEFFRFLRDREVAL